MPRSHLLNCGRVNEVVRTCNPHNSTDVNVAPRGAAAICLAAALWGLDGVVLTPRLSNLAVPFVVFLLHAVPFGLMQPVLFGCWRRLRGL